MILHFRLMSGASFNIEADDSLRISDIKPSILPHLPDKSTPIRLIFKGRVLDDSAVLSSIGLSPRDFMVVHFVALKPHPPPEPQQPPPAPPPPPLPAPRPISGPEFEAQVHAIIEVVGFPQAQVEAALLASHGDPDAAIGILEGDLHPPPQSRLDSLLSRVRTLLIDMPDALEDIVGFLETRNLGIPIDRAHVDDWLRGLNLDPANFNCEGVRNRTAAHLGLFDDMGNAPPSPPPEHPAFVASRATIPEYRAPAGQGDGAGSPREQPPAQSGDAEAVAPGERAGQLTREDVEAIQRLQDLGGWTLRAVIEAYMACDKKESYAANLLFASRQ
jgi:hypothetical protein